MTDLNKFISECRERLADGDVGNIYQYLDDLKLLIEVVERQSGALEWIMPKVHQGNHEGEFISCGKATCQEFRQALADIDALIRKHRGGMNEISKIAKSKDS